MEKKINMLKEYIEDNIGEIENYDILNDGIEIKDHLEFLINCIKELAI